MATQNEIAQHLDIDPRHVRRLISEGVLPATKGRGGLDLDACRVAYIRYLRGITTGQVRARPDGYVAPDPDGDYREKLEYEKWREKKRQNDLEEDKVAPVEQIKDALIGVAAQIVPLLDALPMEMKRRNPALSGHDIMTVKRAIADCRNSIADMELSAG